MVTGLVSIGAIVITFFDMIMAYYGRLAFAYNKAGNVFGVRHNWAQTGYDVWLDKYSFMQQLFGGGTFYRTLILEDKSKSIEIDPLDLLLSNGMVGVSVIYGLWLFFIFKFMKKGYDSGDRYYGIAIFSLTFMIAASFTSGHIIYSSLIGFYLAIIVAHSLVRQNTDSVKP